MNDRYISPLGQRYASEEMQRIFSNDKKFRTWRRLWIALAESEKELGLAITQEQIDELKAHAEDINYDVAREREKIVRHDVMSHVYAYGQQCPNAKGIIHLGATSCFVGDNTDLIVMYEALELVKKKLVNVLAELKSLLWITRTCRCWHLHIFSLHSPQHWESVLLSGHRTCYWIMKSCASFWKIKSCAAAKGQPVHRRALWSCLIMMKRR